MADPVLARDFVFEINTGSDATPVWTRINGLKEWNPASDKTNADTTDFESGGVSEHLVAGRTHGITLTGQRERGDAGQDAVQNTALLIGAAATKGYRITAPGAAPGNIKTFKASANLPWLGSSGGGMNDPAGWEAKLDLTGAITTT